jgi:hypothetical protein
LSIFPLETQFLDLKIAFSKGKLFLKESLMFNINDFKLVLTIVFVLVYGITLLFSLPREFNSQGELQSNPLKFGGWLVFRVIFLVPVILLQTV